MNARRALARPWVWSTLIFGLLLLTATPAAATTTCGTWTAPTEGDAVENSRTKATYPTIQAAIDAAEAGDTLTVTADPHVEGPVNVSKNLTLTGTGTIKAAADTCATGNGRGWFVVPSGVDLTVQGLTFDGNGHQIYQAFRHQGTGSFTDCTFNDIKYQESGPDYQGTAIASFNGFHVLEVSHCTFTEIGRTGVLFYGSGGWTNHSTFTNNTYTGKGTGNWLDYAVDVGAGSNVTISGNTISDCQGSVPGGSTSAGVQATSYYNGITVVKVDDNTITDNAIGIAAGFDKAPKPGAGEGQQDSTFLDATGNTITGNTIGLLAETNYSIDAKNNHWGCTQGPGHPGCDTVGGDWAYYVDTGFTPAVKWEYSSGLTYYSGHVVAGFGPMAGQAILVVATFDPAPPDGTSVTFTADNATLSVSEAEISGGKAATVMSIGPTSGKENSIKVSDGTVEATGPGGVIQGDGFMLLSLSGPESAGDGKESVVATEAYKSGRLFGSATLGLTHDSVSGCDVGLADAQFLGSFTIQGNSVPKTIDFAPPAGFAGEEVYLQVVDEGCNVSNLVTHQF